MSSDNAQGEKHGDLEHQDVSIKARKVELFEEPKVEEDPGARRPFRQFVLQTPPAPLSPGVKASLIATAVLVVLLFLAALILGGPKKVKRRQAAFSPDRPAATAAFARAARSTSAGRVVVGPSGGQQDAATRHA